MRTTEVERTGVLDLLEGAGGRIAHVESLESREAVYAASDFILPDAVRTALEEVGVHRLYSHQAEALEVARGGGNFVVVTGTASGKTLCYNIPVFESLLAENASTLYMFPTKALAQDQLRGVKRMLEASPQIGERAVAGTYDGDTTQHARRKLRTKGNLILSNPDMLHAGILPNHSGWGRFFEKLRYVVLDEIHAYRGIFGSNVGNVIRRLQRVAAHYGASPQFLCSSATIANPSDLAGKLTGKEVRVIDSDGSPRGPKKFVLWNPPRLDRHSAERRSSNVEGKNLMVRFVENGIPTIVFSRARVTAELIHRYAREDLMDRKKRLADKVAVYRGGYLPEDRRAIEKKLFNGELLGVSSTNALELGIDVGSLGASVMVGFPGTIASTWQQAGRAGRTREESISVLIAYNDPIDQYLIRHPDYFFHQSPEHAIVEPENPYILERHLRCAAHELPVDEHDEELFGSTMVPIVEALEDHEVVTRLGDKWYWGKSDYPAADVSLRNISDATFTITQTMDDGKEERTIGTVDAISAPELLYPEAIYLHDGETYFVRELDLEQRVAWVERREVDYYTQAIVESTLRLGKRHKEEALPGGKKLLATATVTWMTVAFKKIKFYSMDSIGWGKLDLPAQDLETMSLGLHVDGATAGLLTSESLKVSEGLAGIRNVLLVVMPLYSMCDPSNLGGIVESSNTGVPTLYLYDRFPQGLGLCEKGYYILDEVLRAALELVDDCPCTEGCPSCVGMPRQPQLHHDPDLSLGFPMPDKAAARRLLGIMTGQQE